MTLEEVVKTDQLPEYYRERGLIDRDAKINHLMAETGVMSIRGSGVDDMDEILALLEDSVTLGHWRSLK